MSYFIDYVDIYQGNHMPHWEYKDTSCVYHIAMHLADSVPLLQLKYWIAERQRMQEMIQKDIRFLSKEEWKRLDYLYSQRVEWYLRNGYGSCVLRDPENALIVKQVLEHDEGKKYNLRCWCIMPNHVHVLVKIFKGVPLQEILRAWKSFSANRINRRLGRRGKLWETDSYNHIIRTQDEYFYQFSYIWHNSDAAGLKNWTWRWPPKIQADN